MDRAVKHASADTREERARGMQPIGWAFALRSSENSRDERAAGFAVPAAGPIPCARDFDAFSPGTLLLPASVEQDVSRNR